MSEHEAFLAYAPRGPGLLCALAYFTVEKDVYGWWTGFKDYRYLSAYFKLDSFYAPENTAFLLDRLHGTAPGTPAGTPAAAGRWPRARGAQAGVG